MSAEPCCDLGTLVSQAVESKASAVLLVPNEPPVFRVQGRLQRSAATPLSAEQVRQIALGAAGPAKIEQIGPNTGAVSVRVRLPDETFATVTVARAGGELTVAVQPVQAMVLDCRTVRVPEAMVRAVESASGLVVVTGRPGSGKTTTAYALLEHLNATRDIHIVTLGYLLEYALEPKRAVIQQRQVGLDVPDMLAGIRSAMLQDPDVLFVGEVRDPEVLDACVGVAELGQMVVTQLHQPTAEDAVRLMIELQPEDTRPTFRRMLARQLRGVLAQSLLVAADGRHRVAVYGVLIPDDEMRQAIADGRDVLDRRTPLPECCVSLADDIARLRDQGEVTPEAAQTARESL